MSYLQACRECIRRKNWPFQERFPMDSDVRDWRNEDHFTSVLYRSVDITYGKIDHKETGGKVKILLFFDAVNRIH